jgi:hypothetical protein
VFSPRKVRSDLPVGSVLDMLGNESLILSLRDAAEGDGGRWSSQDKARRRFLHSIKQAMVCLEDTPRRLVEASSAAIDSLWGALTKGHRSDMDALSCSCASFQTTRETDERPRNRIPVRLVSVTPGSDPWFALAQPAIDWGVSAEVTLLELVRLCIPEWKEGPIYADGIPLPSSKSIREVWRRLAAPDGFLYVVVTVATE